jgi:alpha-amylase
MKLFTILVLILSPVVIGKTKEEWKGRTIYQLLTDRFHKGGTDTKRCENLEQHCGGTFNGIREHLDYIKELGFDAIWISPIPKNQGEDYHGYALINMYEINPHFGTSDDLKKLVEACHEKDIWVMVDVVANHVACVDKDYYKIIPFNRPEHYHSYCEINFDEMWSNKQMRENCRLFCLLDLDQNHPLVRSELLKWVKGVIDVYGFDGIRVDTVAHVPVEFWKEYAEAAGVYQVGEVIHGNPSIIAEYQQAFDGMLNYPLCFVITDVFARGYSMTKIKETIAQNKAVLKDTTVMGNFVDNHDQERFLHINNNLKHLKNALALILMTDGIPIVYYGTEQAYKGGADSNNRESLWDNMDTNSEMYRYIKSIINLRKSEKVWQQEFECLDARDDILLLRRGYMLIAFTNKDELGSAKVKVPSEYNGMKFCNHYDMSDCSIVYNEEIEVKLPDGLPKFYVKASE